MHHELAISAIKPDKILNEGYTPIFISLKEWADTNSSLIEFFLKQFEICEFPNAQTFLDQLLKSGNALIPQGPRPPGGGSGYGWMQDYVEQALAAKLDLTETQVEEALVAGIPMYQIALDNGIAQEDLANFMNEVHQDAFAKAVADWMSSHGFGRGNGGGCPMQNGQGQPFGRGAGMTLAPGASAGMNRHGRGMMGGGWQNQQTNP